MLEDQTNYSRNYITGGVQTSPTVNVVGGDTENVVVQQGDNFIAPMGRTQDMWDPSMRRFVQE